MTRDVTLAGYAVIVAAMVVAQVVGRRRSGAATVGVVLRLLLRHPALRLLVTAAWLWVGWHVFVRADHG